MSVKLVIIGASGVGKTSLRMKYTSGRFSTNYRATIGADFITKAVPHHSNPEESVQLQIWDTAGQERFSSLATAFFRGADAVILVYDVTDAASLPSLAKWWDEFRTRAPIQEGHEMEFPVAVVGNKIDLIEGKGTETWTRKHQRMNSSGSVNGDRVIDEAEARAFLRDLIPVPEHQETSHVTPSAANDIKRDSRASAQGKQPPPLVPNGSADGRGPTVSSNAGQAAHSADPPAIPSPIPDSNRIRDASLQDGNSRATSRSRYANGTMTTTAMSIYHTASSSLVDSGPPTPSGRFRGGAFWDLEVEQAIASNSEDVVGEGEIILDSGYKSIGPAATPAAEGTTSAQPANPHSSSSDKLLDIPSGSPRGKLTSSNSNSSVQTITPSRLNSTTEVPPSSKPQTRQSSLTAGEYHGKSKPTLGPALFFTSAKTGEGLAEVFEYIGARVTQQWEWEESQLHMLDGGGNPGTSGNGDSKIILRDIHDGNAGRGKHSKKWACC